MKLDTVILSSNENQDYLGFWPIVSKAWKMMGIEPILIYTGKEKVNLDGNIIYFDPKNFNSSFVAQNIRLLYPSILKNKTVIISDIDSLPLSRKYYLDSVKNISSNSFVIYRPKACPPNMISIMWNAASSKTWNEVFKVDSEKEIYKKLKKWYSSSYSPQGKAWYTDQIQLRKNINKFSKKNFDRVIELDDDLIGFNRFNRTSLEKNYKEMKKQNIKFSDFHMPKPYERNKDLIDEVLKIHIESILKN